MQSKTNKQTAQQTDLKMQNKAIENAHAVHTKQINNNMHGGGRKLTLQMSLKEKKGNKARQKG